MKPRYLGRLVALALLLMLVAPVTAATSSASAPVARSAAAASAVATRAAAAKARTAYVVPEGAAFNNPLGSNDQRYRLERRIVRAIRATPAKGRIRMAIYSFDRVPVAQELIAAHKRGVTVQVLLNNHQVTRAQRMLHAALGTNRWAKSFTYECRFSCRGHANNLHSKFYLFTRSGNADDVIMLGSQNLTMNAVAHQWNDLWTSTEKHQLFNDFVGLFVDMRHDYSKNRPYYTFCGQPKGTACNVNKERLVNRVFPKRSLPSNDVILDYLNKVQCVTNGQHTHLRLSMHTMRGNRGLYIAKKIRSMYAKGCDFKVLYGLMGFHVKQTLGEPTKRGRIPLRSTGYDTNADGEVDRYTHQKYLVVRGNFGTNPHTNITMTGSSNWSSLGTAQDEIIFTIRGRGNADHYLANWNRMFTPRYSRNAYTTTYASYRTSATRMDASGRPYQVSEVHRAKLVEVLPDNLRPGATWEND